VLKNAAVVVTHTTKRIVPGKGDPHIPIVFGPTPAPPPRMVLTPGPPSKGHPSFEENSFHAVPVNPERLRNTGDGLTGAMTSSEGVGVQ